jgi:hypothetical protein
MLATGAAGLLGAAVRGGPKVRPLGIACGAALFFASEYGTHRFLLHAAPSRSAFVRRLQHRLHYDHHLEPGRLDLLFLPPWFLVPVLGAASFGYTRAAPRNAASLVLGNVLGLLYYEWVHYVAHVAFRPRSRFGRWMKKYHLRHHFLNERLWFGVTNPTLDVVARTYRHAGDAPRSGNVRSLFG